MFFWGLSKTSLEMMGVAATFMPDKSNIKTPLWNQVVVTKPQKHTPMQITGACKAGVVQTGSPRNSTGEGYSKGTGHWW